MNIRAWHFAIILLLLAACSTSEPLPEVADSRGFVSLSQDSQLQELYHSLFTETNRFARNEQLQEVFEVQEFFKIEDQEQGMVTYSAAMPLTTVEYFDNLIIKKSQDAAQAYVLRIAPSETTIAVGFSLIDFTGNLQLMTLDGEVLAATNFNQGKPVPPKDMDNHGKNQGCDYYFVYDVTEVCVNGDCQVTQVTISDVVTVCTADDFDDLLDIGGDGISGGGSGGAVGVVEPDLPEYLVDQKFNLCPPSFTLTQGGFYANVDGLGMSLYNSMTNQVLNAEFGTSCISIPTHYFSTSYDAGVAFAEIFNFARGTLQIELNQRNNTINTSAALRQRFLDIIKEEFGKFLNGATISTSPCSGNIPITKADYGC